jgi:CheY-like chemotaxis protein
VRTVFPPAQFVRLVGAAVSNFGQSDRHCEQFDLGAGFAVYGADSVDEAIRTLERQHGIRLILTDINMPGSMDGLELAHFVRGRWPPVKIIVASGQVCVGSDDLPNQAARAEMGRVIQENGLRRV